MLLHICGPIIIHTKDTTLEIFERLTSSIFFAPAQTVSIAAVSFFELDSDEGDIPKNSKTGHSIIVKRELFKRVSNPSFARGSMTMRLDPKLSRIIS